MLSNLTSAELTDWMVYEHIEPFSDRKADVRNAIVAMVIANSNRKKNTAPFTIDQFIAKFEAPQPQNWQDQIAMLKALYPNKKP